MPLNCLDSEDITTDTTTSTQPTNRPFIIAQPIRLPLEQRPQVVNPFDIMLSAMNRDPEIVQVNSSINNAFRIPIDEFKEEENPYVIPTFRSIITANPFIGRENLNLVNRPLREISNINGD